MDSKATEFEQPALVKSWHLAADPLEFAATEFEWSLVRWTQAFERYQREALSRMRQSNLTTSEALILHIIRMQDRTKSTGMIANLLNRDDIQNIQYSLRKLVAEKLIKKVKDGAGKSYNVAVTEKGRKLTDGLAKLRRNFLIQQLTNLESGEQRLLDAAKMVSMMTALCNEAGSIPSPIGMDEDLSDE